MNPFLTSATMKRLPLHDSHAASITVATVNAEAIHPPHRTTLALCKPVPRGRGGVNAR
jgi:hypothetical protein